MSTDDANQKQWEYANPFKRINSPSKGLLDKLADGQGYLKGCHAPSDGDNGTFLGWLLNGLMRTIPGWVPVSGETEFEVEGSLFHSFQTWTDVPVWQWHRWYDWNFHLVPDPDYKYIAGPANQGPTPDEMKDLEEKGERWIGKAGSIECEWDCGAFGNKPGPMFSRDWAWPMTNQRVWIAGRWIYDCGHATNKNNKDPRRGPVGLMRTELHPCKAIASARWEAFNFPENGGLYVPAIQFMFFASSLGGYRAFPTLGGHDYEFIVDLPKLNAGQTVSAPIGATPDFALNTVALRTPHLLHKFDYDAFSNAAGSKASVVPVIEPIAPADPSQPPQQAKIKIPLSGASGDYFGVIISLGWYDPDHTQARKVLHCQVKLDNLHKGDVDHDTFSEEWSIKIGVNGRWYTQYWDGVRNDTTLKLIAPSIDIWLSEDDFITISSHGAEIDLVGGFFDGPEAARTLRLGPRVVNWGQDVMSNDLPTLWRICYAIAGMMWTTFKDENDPLGIIDPGPLPPGPLPPVDPNPAQKPGINVALRNPIQIRYLTDSTIMMNQNAFFTEADEQSAELAVKPSTLDYVLNFTIKVQRQQVP